MIKTKVKEEKKVSKLATTPDQQTRKERRSSEKISSLTGLIIDDLKTRMWKSLPPEPK